MVIPTCCTTTSPPKKCVREIRGTLIEFAWRNVKPAIARIRSTSLEFPPTAVPGQPLPGAQVVLIPSRNRYRTELFRPVAADSTGRFVIASIAPGEYTLAAWDAIEPYAFFDPALMVQAERQGKGIRVTESSNQTVNVT